MFESALLLLNVIYLLSGCLCCIPEPDTVYLPVPEASCTFRNKTMCRYIAVPDWQPTEGQSVNNQSSPPEVVLKTGQDDEFYMLFQSVNRTNATVAITSPNLPSGQYQILFSYAMNGQEGLLELNTQVLSSQTSYTRWNQTYTGQMNWIQENVTFRNSENFTIVFKAYDDRASIIGLDHVEVCRDCKLLTAPVHGNVSHNGTTYGSLARIICYSGYRIKGSAISICKASGKWSDTCQMCVPANKTDVIHRTCVGDCTFNGGDQCQYKLDNSWKIRNGPSTIRDRTVITGGQDDNIYAVFEPQEIFPGDPLYSMTSPLLPGGAACLSFYYTIPAVGTTLHVRTRTEENATIELWNVTGRAMKNWTRVNGLVLWQSREYFVEYGAKTGNNLVIGIDNIHLESFYCDIGYNLNRSEVDEYCNSSRTEFPSCQLVDCGHITAPKNGNVSADSTTYGSIATVQCQAGYILNGGSTSECGSNGKWNLTGQTCEPVVCGSFSAPQNGNVTATNTTLGSTAKITCAIGYILSGSNTSTCDVNGRWRSQTQSCTPVDCGYITAPNHGNISANTTTYGSIATVRCQAGYILNGSSTSECGSDGKWKFVGQTCELVDCGPFKSPTNSHLSSGPSTYNSTVPIFCSPGYVLVGNRISTCGENGNWNNADQECVLQTVFLKVKEASCIFEENNTCMCNNASSVQILDGNSNFDVRFESNDSFPLRGHGNACYTMRRDNTSLQQNLSFIMTSPALQPGLYQISFQQMFPFGEVRVDVESENNETSDLESFWKYMERDTKWLNETVNLIEDKIFRIVFRANETKNGLLGIYNIDILKACDLFNISNGHIIVDKNTAYFRCNEGYRLVGNSSATCTQWTWSSEAPSCELIDCGTPIAPSNGYVASNSTSYGSVSTVSCSIGYFVKGNYTGVCGNNQEWTHENTTCLSIDSTMLSAIIPGCSNHGWNIAANLTFLRSLIPNYKSEMQIYLGNASCKGSERRGFLVYDNNFYECMTRNKVSANLNIFENQMVVIFDPETSAASNAYNWTIDLHCNVVDKNIVTSVSTNQLNSDANSISISVFIDPFFRMALPSNPLHVHIGDTVYVKVSSPIRDPEIKLLLKSCYIRPALEKDSRLDSALMQNGCEVESSIHVISISAHEIQFMFQNYAPFALREGMNVICDVAYCNSQELTLDCNQTCNRMLAPVIVG
ncbi:uncharacterized protein LOC127874770 isoform X9 [Dreissena polymorpha]|uniref:uncharacterized protein LOC127874770 isoform X9 n=1 Tax=Dreissena polymorpha TaxID=45954 RepID=UPI00226555EA|nr:uncharacterized protein LOC127874770 isoform X9 [Dreissena polymorpha]